jgi:hypothetical protein
MWTDLTDLHYFFFKILIKLINIKFVLIVERKWYIFSKIESNATPHEEYVK